MYTEKRSFQLATLDGRLSRLNLKVRMISLVNF